MTGLGRLLLVEVVFAVFVCALAVHAGSVRLIFAMARDNNLPFAHALSQVSSRTRAPVVPSVVIGALAAMILILNVNLPHVIEMLCSVAIIWANLAYLLVTFPLLWRAAAAQGSPAFAAFNDDREPARSRLGHVVARADHSHASTLFLAGPARTADQRDRGVLGPFRRDQHRLAATGDLRFRRMGPVRGAAGDTRPGRRRRRLLSPVQRKRTGILTSTRPSGHGELQLDGRKRFVASRSLEEPNTDWPGRVPGQEELI